MRCSNLLKSGRAALPACDQEFDEARDVSCRPARRAAPHATSSASSSWSSASADPNEKKFDDVGGVGDGVEGVSRLTTYE